MAGAEEEGERAEEEGERAVEEGERGAGGAEEAVEAVGAEGAGAADVRGCKKRLFITTIIPQILRSWYNALE